MLSVKGGAGTLANSHGSQKPGGGRKCLFLCAWEVAFGTEMTSFRRGNISATEFSAQEQAAQETLEGFNH